VSFRESLTIKKTQFLHYIRIIGLCSYDFGFFFQKGILWFLSRDREPSEEIRSRVYAKIKSYGIRTDPLQKTLQQGCPES